ncbi:MAG: DUF2231 domain-containing protein [Chloroflexota bacterium]|nr:DUF2231 domain-containing protein [Chloroflexota bacterium]
MESRAKLLGHAIHPMLIVFPLGLLGMAAIFDVIYLATGVRELVTASYWMIAAGVVTGLLAAVFGFWDWLAIPSETRAKKVGLLHGAGNVVVVSLFVVAWLLRLDGRAGAGEHAPDGLPVVIEILGLLLALVSGWLGGELVERLGVGVDQGAHLQAPSSLSTSSGLALDKPAKRSAPRRVA